MANTPVLYNPDLLTMTWGLDRLQIAACWEQGLTGAGVRIGHLDTGVATTHPALRDRLASFAQFDAWGDRVPNAQPWDSGDHGTHTAGLICGGAIAGQAIGIAPQAQLCSGIVIEGGHPLVRVLAGLDWLLDQQIRVLCLSLGVPGYNPLFEIALARLRQQGVLVVCPIGNHGRRISCSPANYPGVLAVGAIDAQDQIPRFSGSGVGMVAPGVEILSATPEGELATQDGTSMAAAIVAGIAALLFQAKPTATVEEVEQALLNSCTPLPHLPTQWVGHGLVNPIAAVDYLLQGNERDDLQPARNPCTCSDVSDADAFCPLPDNPCRGEALGQSSTQLQEKSRPNASPPPHPNPQAFCLPGHRVDLRLQRQLDAANPEDTIAAVAIVASATDPLTQPHDAGLGEQVIQRVLQQQNVSHSNSLRFIPRANAIALTATPDFFHALLQEPEVCFLSSTTIDLIYLG